MSETYFQTIPYDAATERAVSAAVAAWRDFLALPQPLKDHLTSADLQSGNGYERKSGDGSRESHDFKQNFDISRAGLDQFVADHDDPHYRQFFVAIRALFDRTDPLAVQFAATIERRYQVTDFAAQAAAGHNQRFLRFLAYPPTPVDSTVGEAHADHSGYTFHLYESTAGCEYLDAASRGWQPLTVAPAAATAFAGLQLQLASRGDCLALWHRIRANTTAATAGRIAIVCFNTLPDQPTYDRARHGRIQAMTPGATYDLPPEQFRDLFTTTPEN